MQSDLTQTHRRILLLEDRVDELTRKLRSLEDSLEAQNFLIMELNRSLKVVKRGERYGRT